MTEIIESTMPIVYGINEQQISTLRAECSGLTADTKQGYEQVRLAIGKVRDIRVAIEKRRVELKADALEWGRKVDSEAKRITAALVAIEEPLKLEKAKVDEAKERERKAKEEAERLEREAKERAIKEAEEARIKAEREAEQARLAEERKAIEAERAKLAEERRKQQAEAKAERERLDAIRREEEAKQRAERDRIEAAQRKLDEERRKVQEAAEKLAREKAAAEADAKRQEAERIRQEALKPDRQKVAEFAKFIRDMPMPVMSTQEGQQFIDSLDGPLNDIAAACEDWSEA